MSRTDSEIPRRLIAATARMNASAIPTNSPFPVTASSQGSWSRPKPGACSATWTWSGSPSAGTTRVRFPANARAAEAADVRPEAITAKVTRYVSTCTRNARCAYAAAPPAVGYLVTSSR